MAKGANRFRGMQKVYDSFAMAMVCHQAGLRIMRPRRHTLDAVVVYISKRMLRSIARKSGIPRDLQHALEAILGDAPKAPQAQVVLVNDKGERETVTAEGFLVPSDPRTLN